MAELTDDGRRLLHLAYLIENGQPAVHYSDSKKSKDLEEEEFRNRLKRKHKLEKKPHKRDL